MDRPSSLLAIYRWPLALVAIGILALLALLATLRSIQPGAMTRVNVTNRFIESLPEISRTQGGLLELATAKTTETFQRSDEHYTAWGWIYLGATVSEIRVPVTYRYHLKLADKWNVEIKGHTCRVLAPAIQPSLPPAIHTDLMEKRVENGWARFDGSEQLAALERDITPTLDRYAGDPRHLALVREDCRKTVEEFVRAWLLREQHSGGDFSVKVIFADEAVDFGNPATTGSSS